MAMKKAMDEEYRRKHSKIMSPIMKELRKDPEYRRRHRDACNTPECKLKHVEIMKERWQDSGFCEMMFKAWQIKPTKPEIKINKLLRELLPNEYKYVGDGQFILGGKCPDFLNINGKKKLIELYGDYWHGVVHNDISPQDRIDYFKQFGFDCLVIWEHELEEPIALVKRILDFHKGR